MKYLRNCWTDLRQIHREDTFGPLLGPSLRGVWMSWSKVRSRSKVKGRGHQGQKTKKCVIFRERPRGRGPPGPCVRCMFKWASRSLSFFGWLLNKKAARVEVNILLAFLHWVRITLHPWPFVSDIAIFVLNYYDRLTAFFQDNLGKPEYSCWKGTSNSSQLTVSVTIWGSGNDIRC